MCYYRGTIKGQGSPTLKLMLQGHGGAVVGFPRARLIHKLVGFPPMNCFSPHESELDALPSACLLEYEIGRVVVRSPFVEMIWPCLSN